MRSGPVPFVHAYTYDHNGNRLTQSVNGSLAQSFAYDLHDKLTGAAGSGESESYDLNGNLLVQTVNGQTTRFTWDDEDRLTGQTFPDGHSDSYTYTGLGMRLTKSDPTGSYSYLADGVSPASDVLSDGRTSFTPGISEVNSLGSRFYLPDAQGNSRGLLDGNQAAQDGYNWDGFGNIVSRFGSNPTAFAWNVSSGYQSDGDSGLKLLGHRYYDSRTGRFISQDPAGDGDNWYAYAGNDPMDAVDPTGLSLDPNTPGAVQYSDGSYHYPPGVPEPQAGGAWFSDDGNGGVVEHSSSTIHIPSGPASNSGPGGGGMSVGHPVNERLPGESGVHYFFRGLGWAIQQALTSGADPGTLGATRATRGPDGRFVRDPNATKTPEFDPKKARRLWEKAKGRPWPKDPQTGQNFDAHHINMKSQGGALYDPNNITPVHPDMHDRLHASGGPYDP